MPCFCAVRPQNLDLAAQRPALRQSADEIRALIRAACTAEAPARVPSLQAAQELERDLLEQNSAGVSVAGGLLFF